MLCFEVWLAHKYSSYFSDMSHFILFLIQPLDSTLVEWCVESISLVHPPYIYQKIQNLVPFALAGLQQWVLMLTRC